MRRTALALTLALGGVAYAGEAHGASLRGSPASMVEQNTVAKDHGLDFYRTPADIRAAVDKGELVPLEANEDYAVADFVRFPYVRPELKIFVERLSQQYREACGQRLVVTSATRPSNGQPSNAHQLSVHPAGMALDLRVSDRAACRSWLENALLGMERRGLLNGIRENRPPHYHVAVYPEPYMAYVRERMAEEPAVVAVEEAVAADEAAPMLLAAGMVDGGGTGSNGGLMTLVALILLVPLGTGLLVDRLGRRGSAEPALLTAPRAN
jgi:hypothetical protein